MKTSSGRGVTAGATAAAILLAMLVVPPPANGQEEPVVTSAVQVTDNEDPARAHSSPQLAINPTNGELVIVETEMRTRKTCDVHLSVDDGRSWFDGGNPMVEPFTDCAGDPISTLMFSVAFDPNGVLYLAFTAHDPRFNASGLGDQPRHVFLARSTDSGRSFETKTVYEAPEDGDPEDPRRTNRRPMIAIDPVDSARVYISWQQSGGGEAPDKAFIAASDDGGLTFAEPVDLAGEEGGYQARPAVDGDGVVHAVIPSRGYADPRPEEPLVRPLSYRRSTDHGQTWSEPTVVDQGNAGFTFARKWLLAADPTSSALYVVWYGNEDPRATRPEDDREIFLRVSQDGGDTWSDRQMVNDDGNLEQVQHHDPGMSIAPNGRLDLAWLDFRNSPMPEADAESAPFNSGGFQDVYYASSTDRGETLSSNVRITDRSIDRRIGVWSNNVHSHAPVGIASTDDSVYFTWQDTRNGDEINQSEDVYFAALKLQGPVNPGSGDADVPGWALVVVGTVLGMGVAMVAALAVSRRSRTTPPAQTA